MTKQSNRSPRCRRGSLWIAMLATLAFAGAGQALTPSPAAAWRVDVCDERPPTLCNPLDESPDSGDQPGGDGKTGRNLDAWGSTPPRPSSASWDDREPNGTPTWSIAGLSIKIYRHICERIGNRAAAVERLIEIAYNDDRDTEGLRRVKEKLKQRLYDLDDRWDEYNCTELGL